jgi:hypothetical protein
MPVISQALLPAIQPELSPTESILWADQPSPRIPFHKQDRFPVPFPLIWGGFAIFWEAGGAGFWGLFRQSFARPMSARLDVGNSLRRDQTKHDLGQFPLRRLGLVGGAFPANSNICLNCRLSLE